MKRLMLPVAFVPLLISALSMSVSIGLANDDMATPIKQYLPLIRGGPPAPITFVETALRSCATEQCQYGSNSYVFGYVRTTSSTAVYSPTLGVDVTIVPYCPSPEPCESYRDVRIATPAFPVTLPGQPNPFSYSLVNGKSQALIHGVAWVTGRPAQASEIQYQPLTIVQWDQEGSRLFGTVRNDTGRSLRQVRVVAAATKLCSWQEMRLETTTLGPAEAIAFEGDYFCKDDLVVVGQGAVIP